MSSMRWARRIKSTPVKVRSSAEADEWVFEFHRASSLPIIDLLVTPLSLIAGEAVNRRFFGLMRKHYGKLIVLFRIGAVVMAVTLVTKTHVGRISAIVTCALGFNTLVASTLMMSWELLRLLCMTHEVVFMSIMNATNWIIIVSFYRDVRSVVCLMPWWGIQLSICSDAMYRTLVSSSKSSVLALLMMLVFIVFVFLHAVDVLPEHYATIKINDFEIDAVVVFVNVSSTLSVLVSCIVYRHRRVLKNASLKLITCALLRTRLTLVPASRTASSTASTHMQMKLRRESVLGSRSRIATQSARLRQHRAKLARAALAAYRLKAPAISFSARSKLLAAASDHSSPHRQLLRIVPQALKNIDSRDTLVRHVTPSKDLSRWEKRALYLVGMIGMNLTVASFMLLDVRENVTGTIQIVLQVGAFVTSGGFVAVFVACMQRQLLRSLAYRFDLLFSAFQFIAASLFLAKMLQWDTRCLVVMASMMWFAWSLFVDALTPRVRRHLGFKSCTLGLRSSRSLYVSFEWWHRSC